MVSYGFLDCDAVGVLNLLEQKNFSEVKSHSLIWDWFLQTFSGMGMTHSWAYHIMRRMHPTQKRHRPNWRFPEVGIPPNHPF